ncbi:Cell division protein ftsQ [Granulibacter bethesdensis]|uniref:Cell division protein FtsQ n=2 Tax=Granulibacter bethesdensis TaxID=364410 RepID=Q0BV29_GRABC|nr:Cell division protein ftsQ [Granulibacter bethesdensis CGDNIH1]AHJ67440.1 Cell division protein ftsQ [Granulibacter bethesdensis]APH51111.1 Cell division protein ftsQ [Granulibacter bethesdensis]APH63804.1 Cell division protein ftsQ [Granulibacter bethesdensis]
MPMDGGAGNMSRVTQTRERRASSSKNQRIQDRPARMTILLRRQRRLLRPLGWGVLGISAVVGIGVLLHVAAPQPNINGNGASATLASLRKTLGEHTATLGMRIQDIVIEGRSNTPEPLLNAALGVRKGDPLLGFSVAEARQRIETLSWVENASVERRLPGTIVVKLTERRPFAIWQNQGKFVLIDRDGQIVADQDVATFRTLPLVVGAGAPAAATTLLDALKTEPEVKAHVIAAVRVNGRRWNLRLQNGTDVLLPEDHPLEAIKRLAALHKEHELLDRPLQSVDLRLPDRMVLRPRSEAITEKPAIRTVRRQT